MHWAAAVHAMRESKYVRRRTWMAMETVKRGPDGVPIVVTGIEPCYLAAGWSDDDRPVRVFRGAWSGLNFIPLAEDMDASDWVIVEA